MLGKAKKFIILSVVFLMLITPTVASKTLTTDTKEASTEKAEEEKIQIVEKEKKDFLEEKKPVEEYTEYEFIPLSNSNGILPGFALVRCRWKIYDEGEAERTIHFWVFGWGSHEITWDTLDDHDGDGTWDLGPGTPWHYEWFAFLFPLRHYDDWCYWDGYPGRAKVKVMYNVDDNSKTKTFQEPI